MPFLSILSNERIGKDICPMYIVTDVIKVLCKRYTSR